MLSFYTYNLLCIFGAFVATLLGRNLCLIHVIVSCWQLHHTNNNNWSSRLFRDICRSDCFVEELWSVIMWDLLWKAAAADSPDVKPSTDYTEGLEPAACQQSSSCAPSVYEAEAQTQVCFTSCATLNFAPFSFSIACLRPLLHTVNGISAPKSNKSSTPSPTSPRPLPGLKVRSRTMKWLLCNSDTPASGCSGQTIPTFFLYIDNVWMHSRWWSSLLSYVGLHKCLQWTSWRRAWTVDMYESRLLEDFQPWLLTFAVQYSFLDVFLVNCLSLPHQRPHVSYLSESSSSHLWSCCKGGHKARLHDPLTWKWNLCLFPV